MPTPEGLEFSVTLDDATQTRTYEVVIDTGGLTPSLSYDGQTLLLKDEAGIIQARLGAPWLFDADNSEPGPHAVDIDAVLPDGTELVAPPTPTPPTPVPIPTPTPEWAVDAADRDTHTHPYVEPDGHGRAVSSDADTLRGTVSDRASLAIAIAFAHRDSEPDGPSRRHRPRRPPARPRKRRPVTHRLRPSRRHRPRRRRQARRRRPAHLHLPFRAWLHTRFACGTPSTRLGCGHRSVPFRSCSTRSSRSRTLARPATSAPRPTRPTRTTGSATASTTTSSAGRPCGSGTTPTRATARSTARCAAWSISRVCSWASVTASRSSMRRSPWPSTRAARQTFKTALITGPGWSNPARWRDQYGEGGNQSIRYFCATQVGNNCTATNALYAPTSPAQPRARGSTRT